MVAGGHAGHWGFSEQPAVCSRLPFPVLAMLLSSPSRGPGWAPVPWCHPQGVLVRVLLGTRGFLMLKVCRVMLPAQDAALCVGFSSALVVVNS